jgi:1-aminocyclopropane-1-carboxylate deaminase
MRKTSSDKFGRITPEVLQSMNLFYERTGVPTELVYTGKMVNELMKDLLLPINCEKKSILIVHTGGLQGNRSLPSGSLKFMG